jgi:cell division protein ZapA (FtsZ GTPase activity inhibitor)
MDTKNPVVSLEVGGQLYRIVSSLPEDELKRLAAVVDARIRSIVPKGKPTTPSAILLAAIALVRDAEDAAARHDELRVRSRDVMRRLLARIDEALESHEDEMGDEPEIAQEPADP